MKTDEFDDKIRQKIESIETPYTNAEVEAAFRYATKRTGGLRLFRYSGHAAVAAVAACISALLVWNFALQKQVRMQDQTIAQLNKSLQYIETQLHASEHDTVYVISNRTADPSIENLSENAAQNITKSDNTINNNNTNRAIEANDSPQRSAILLSNTANARSQNTVATKTDATAKRSSTLPSDQSSNKAQANNTRNNSNTNNSLLYTANQSTANDTKNLLLNHTNETNIQQNETTDMRPQTNDAQAQTQSNANTSETYSQSLQNTTNDSIAAVDSVEQQPAPQATAKQTRKREPIDWGKLFDPFDIRYGGAIEGAPRQLSVAAIGELRFKACIGLLSGIKIKGIQTGNYNDRDDFWRRRGYDFTTNYSQQTNTADQTNINTRTMILQVPVYLNYYHALRNNYSLMISAGADIDLVAWQSIEYDRQSNMMHERHNFKQLPVTPINTISIMPGIQKQWSKCALQLNPFVSIPLATVSYRERKVDGGLQLRLLFWGKNSYSTQ